MQDSVFTRAGIARVARYAAHVADKRGGRLVSATKSNGITEDDPARDAAPTTSPMRTSRCWGTEYWREMVVSAASQGIATATADAARVGHHAESGLSPLDRTAV